MNRNASKAEVQNLAYVEMMYSDYRRDPQSVPAEWREYFAKTGNGDGTAAQGTGPSFRPRSVFNPATPADDGPVMERELVDLDPRATNLSDRLYRLIRNYRVRGHIIAEVNPLGFKSPCPTELMLETYGFS